MTVKELKEQLDRLPDHSEVMLIDECEGTYSVTNLKAGNYHPYYSEIQGQHGNKWIDMAFIGNDERIEIK